MDPTKRLTVLNKANPSIRLAVTPSQPQSISVANGNAGNISVANNPAPTPDIQVGNQTVGAQPVGNSWNTPDPVQYHGLDRVVNDVVNVGKSIAKPVYNFGKAAYYVPQMAAADITNNPAAQASTQRKAFGTNDSGQIAKSIVGNTAQTGLFFVPGLGEGASAGGKIALDAAAGAGFGAASTFTDHPNATAADYAKNAGLGAALGGLARPLTSMVGKVVSKVKGSKLNSLASEVAASNDTAHIQNTLGVNNDVASYLASETDPEIVKSVIKEVSAGSKAPVAETAADNQPADPNPILPDNRGTAEYWTAIEEKAKTDPQAVIDELSNPDNTPAYQRGYAQPGNPELATTPNASNAAKEAYAAEASTTRKSTSTDAQAYEAGLDPNNPLDSIPAYQRKQSTLPEDSPSAQRLTDIQKQLGVMPTPEKVQSVIFNLKKQLGEAIRQHPDLEPELRARYEKNVASIQDTLDQRTKLQSEADSLTPGQVSKEMVGGAPAKTPEAAQTEQVAKEVIASTPAKSEVPAEAAVSQPVDAAAMDHPTDAKAAFPNADPESQKAIQDVLDSLNEAKTTYDAKGKVVAKEKAQRAAAAEHAYQAAGGGEAGFKAKLSALKGSYSESGFNPITAAEGTQKSILDDIASSDLMPFEKTNTQNAFRKIWGTGQGKPTPSDISYIRKYAGDDMANAIEDAVQKDPENWRDVAAKIAGTPRALMATADFSFGGRQGAPLGTRFPKEWAVANKESVKYAANKDYYDREMQAIRDSKYYSTMTDKMKLSLQGANKGVEEGFAAADYAEAIPLAGGVVRGSDRAYTGGLTKLRFETAKKVIDSYGGPEEFNKFFEQKGGDEALKALGEVINTFSGRGGKQGGALDQHMKTLSTTLFAPRLWAAKLNSLNPVWYARLAKTSPEAAKLAIQTQAAFLTTAGTVLSIAGAAGATVVWDPRSADFAKIKVGNTRYDILGGLQQNIRLIAQEATGTKINSTTGEPQTLGDGFGKPNRKDILYQAFENKENPLLAYASKLLAGKDQGGNPVNPVSETAKLVIPLNAQGVYSTAKDVGSAGKGAAMNIPGFFGVGVQTYGGTPTKNQVKDANGKVVGYKGKIEPNMVTDNNGQVIIDKNGKPVTVTFPKDATELEKQAMLDAKAKSAKGAEFKSKLSGEDQALMKLTDQQLKQYVSDGKIDQTKFDHIKNVQKGANSAEAGIAIPDGAKSDTAKSFYQKYHSMDTKDQKAWLTQSPDENAKAIATQLNAQRSKGLSEYKPSNQLSKAYAEYENDINTHPEYTEVDKRNKAKTLQTTAAKLNYNQDTQDIFAEGGSADLKTLITNKHIKADDLNNAIALDNELYASGLTGSLKFSKTFRQAYGFGVPSTGGADTSSGGSGNSKYGPDAHLASLLPTFTKPTPVQRTTAMARSNPGAPRVTFKPNPNDTPAKGSTRVTLKPYRTVTTTRLRNSVAG